MPHPALRRRLAAYLATALMAAAGMACLPAAASPSAGSSMAFCQPGPTQSAATQDRILQLASAVRAAVSASGARIALIGRSGLSLERFGLRYSHAGVLLADGTDVPWSVRQLYYDCDEGRPRLFDQGLAGFLLSADAPGAAHVSLVLLPAGQADALRTTALHKPLAQRLLAATYSANAYPFSTLYQNCNQWVAELMAAAWGQLPDAPDLRQQAQHWLRAAGYTPTRVNIGSHLTKLAASLMPLIHLNDHPEDDQLGLMQDISLPDALEAFARQQAPGAQRLAFCLDGEKIVTRHGWQPLPPDTPEGLCVAEAGDTVQPLRP
ncbi:MAG: DUF2145 domain-containing protein [Pseudomonadota bacterium]|nr:DUF2145 domain-containing protein [Pseudomonadota bacterium]